MSPPRRGARGDQTASAPTPPVGETRTSVTGSADIRHDARSVAIRVIAQRELDELLDGGPAPLVLGDPLDWSAIHMDLGVPERDELGRELAMAGWVA